MTNNIHNELKEAISFVENVQAQLGDGKVVELSELQNNVAQICKVLAAMAVEEGRAYREQMLELSEKMEHLEVDLRAKKIDIEREIRGANSNKSATSAYEKAKAGGQDDSSKKNES